MNHQLTPETPDAELVRRAQAGELDAFEALTSRYEQRVYALAMRMLRQKPNAEDVTQQTFLSVLEHLEGFRGEASFATWVLRIASRAALKVIRKRKGLDTNIPWKKRPKSSEIPIPSRTRNTSPTGGSRRNIWWTGTKFADCSTRHWRGWTLNTAWFFCCATWKGSPSRKPPTRWI